jgi:2-polyprenyl-6-methoxyphenol hydroxylase-like FAD-dependent oxidoreductase
MASMVVIGGGMAGLLSAMLLADDGHEVIVLERDPEPVPTPAEAWDSWGRRGVNQFRLLHFLHPRFRLEAERELPRVIAALEEAGALRLNIITGAPTELTGGPRPGDEDFTLVTARRPVTESVVATCAQATAGVTVRRGVAVAGVVTENDAASGIPHVTGVRTDEGEVIAADLVVDASGRRSPLPDWLEAAGGRRPVEELEDSGFIYYGRHFRSADGSLPPIMGPLLQNYGSISILTLPADNGTWGMAVIASAADKAMRAVRQVDPWTALVKSLPLAAHWLEGEPIDDAVAMMAKIEDRHRCYVSGGEPVVTGVVAVADSWACTNPSLGRGITMAMMHALALRDLLRHTEPDDAVGLAVGWDEATAQSVEPWYRATLAFDRHRLADIDAEIRGQSYRTDDPAWEMAQSLQFAAGRDPDCLRAFLRVVGMLQTPTDAVSQPGLFDKVVDLGGRWRQEPTFGPTRDELVSIVSA